MSPDDDPGRAGHDGDAGDAPPPSSGGDPSLAPLDDPYLGPDSDEAASAAPRAERYGSTTGRRHRLTLALSGLAVLVALSGIAWGLSTLGSYAGLWPGVEPKIGSSDRVPRAERGDDEDDDDDDDTQAADRSRAQPSRHGSPSFGSVPAQTKVEQIGDVTVVDVGHEEDSLEDVLAEQRREATAAGEKVLVMTVTGDCEPCQGVAASLSDPKMQEALRGVRLVRIDLEVFRDELDALHMVLWHGRTSRFPGYFLLRSDLSWADAIDGGEWGDDVADNIAPVLGPFVRGELSDRKTVYERPVAGGIRL